jgi:hypothetical protein
MLLGYSDQRRSVSANFAASPGKMVMPQRCSLIGWPISPSESPIITIGLPAAALAQNLLGTNQALEHGVTRLQRKN